MVGTYLLLEMKLDLQPVAAAVHVGDAVEPLDDGDFDGRTAADAAQVHLPTEMSSKMLVEETGTVEQE